LNYRAEAKIEGVLVQEMVGQSHEMFVGMVRDPTFGAVMTFGLGGIYVEVLKDLVFRLAPLSRHDISEALNELHVIKLLQGVRGQPPADIDALVDCIERVSWLAADCADKIAEIDINPLCVLELGQGVRVVDALVIL
jgi:acyl-CoA synthetase (NDP forming)